MDEGKEVVHRQRAFSRLRRIVADSRSVVVAERWAEMGQRLVGGPTAAATGTGGAAEHAAEGAAVGGTDGTGGAAGEVATPPRREDGGEDDADGDGEVYTPIASPGGGGDQKESREDREHKGGEIGAAENDTKDTKDTRDTKANTNGASNTSDLTTATSPIRTPKKTRRRKAKIKPMPIPGPGASRADLLGWIQGMLKIKKVGSSRLMSLMDDNRSGTASFNEFASGLTAANFDLKRDEYMRLFKAVDLSGDKSVSMGELKEVLYTGKKYKYPMSATRAASSMAELDDVDSHLLPQWTMLQEQERSHLQVDNRSTQHLMDGQRRRRVEEERKQVVEEKTRAVRNARETASERFRDRVRKLLHVAEQMVDLDFSLAGGGIAEVGSGISSSSAAAAAAVSANTTDVAAVRSLSGFRAAFARGLDGERDRLKMDLREIASALEIEDADRWLLTAGTELRDDTLSVFSATLDTRHRRVVAKILTQARDSWGRFTTTSMGAVGAVAVPIAPQTVAQRVTELEEQTRDGLRRALGDSMLKQDVNAALSRMTVTLQTECFEPFARTNSARVEAEKATAVQEVAASFASIMVRALGRPLPVRKRERERRRNMYQNTLCVEWYRLVPRRHCEPIYRTMVYITFICPITY